MPTAALVLALAAGEHMAASVVLIVLLAAAGLESIFGHCVGCKVFGLLMRAGMISPDRLRRIRRHRRSAQRDGASELRQAFCLSQPECRAAQDVVL
jgi:Domain of unknown function (DUF4395)